MKSLSKRRGSLTGLAVLVLLLVVTACSSAPPPEPAKKIDFSEESQWPYLKKVTDPRDFPDFRPAFADREKSLMALDESLAYFAKPSSKKYYPYDLDPETKITHERQVATLHGLRRILEQSNGSEEFQGWCTKSLDVYQSVGGGRSGIVLYTAYCEPIFDGSLTQTGTYQYPLYKLPADLVKDEEGRCLGRRTPEGSMVSYYSRSDIETLQVLRGTELVWLKDPFEVYIAHVQGSARINLRDGRQLCVGYAGKNDKDYTSIGKKLIEEKKIPADGLSLTALKRYFKDNPSEVKRVLSKNESYVFFTEREPGPFGSIGSKVTAWHTVATDKTIFPRGGAVIVDTRVPQKSSSSRTGVEFQKTTLLAFDQDTGGAIKAAGRADLFIGTGPDAELMAGYTQEQGKLFYIFLKESAILP